MFRHFSVILSDVLNKAKYSNAYLCHRCALVEYFFVEYLPEYGRKRPKRVAILPHVYIFLIYLIRVQLLGYMCNFSYCIDSE